MNFGGHVEAGWLLAHTADFSLSERRLITLLAILPDADGLFFFSATWNEYAHRTFGHNIWVFICAPLVASLFVSPARRLRVAPLLYISLGLHFFLDLFVTGWWELRPLFPLHGGNITMSHVLTQLVPLDWEWVMKYPVQIGLLAVLTAGTIVVYLKYRRTPLEVISPRLDKLVMNFLLLPWHVRCSHCGKPAFYRCSLCSAALCPHHRSITLRLHIHCSPGCTQQ
jgi:membrane-bound metal-dependent hydrolase YbcI (DUF457 family)